MKALLLHPPLGHLFSRGQPAYYFQEQGIFPPLGILSIAAYLRKHTRHTVQVQDLRIAGLDEGRLRAYLERSRPDIVGITCLTHFLYDTLQTAAAVKRALPDTPIVWGGHHTSLYPAETLGLPHVDAVVVGAGEAAFAELVDRYAEDGRVPRLAGVLRPGDGVTDIRAETRHVAHLDELPFPARELVPVAAYRYAVSKRRLVTVMMTSAGCPYPCIFCDARMGQTRYRTPGRVVDEIADCARLGVEEILIQDENFAQKRDRVLAIADEIQRRRFDVVWSFESRVDHIDRELARAVRRAGCYSIHFGIESGSADILEQMRKGITLTQAREAFRILKQEGLGSTASFMIGLPGETLEHVERTIAFACELDPDYVQFSATILLPGTPMYEQAVAKGLVKDDPWREFAADPKPTFAPPGWHEHFSREQIAELLERAYRSFYLRPRYVLRRLRGVRDVHSLVDHARIAARIALRR